MPKKFPQKNNLEKKFFQKKFLPNKFLLKKLLAKFFFVDFWFGLVGLVFSPIQLSWEEIQLITQTLKAESWHAGSTHKKKIIQGVSDLVESAEHKMK